MENPWAYGDPTEEKDDMINPTATSAAAATINSTAPASPKGVRPIGVSSRDMKIINVIGDRGFCVPYPLELIVKKKIQGFSKAQFEVLDANGNNPLLRVDGNVWKLQSKRVMYDPAGFPVLTLREKVLTKRHQWTCHLGESSENDRLLFKVQRSSPIQFKSRLEVFLADNNGKNQCDFHVIGQYTNLSFKVCQGKTILAEVNHNFKWANLCRGKESFRVKVQPDVDYAFIVAMLVILEELDNM
ncbi:protein LURP-one-related 14-like [Rutidosis leptorrhynchoides]|uniref:protein LURP-one-related 14-like n=1 Tax=Rutidosis leptorrhynchoides TaxID=125765 RepID=UPI003A993FF7